MSYVLARMTSVSVAQKNVDMCASNRWKCAQLGGCPYRQTSVTSQYLAGATSGRPHHHSSSIPARVLLLAKVLVWSSEQCWTTIQFSCTFQI